MKVVCEVSLGELVDKITILRIKQKMITDNVKLEHIAKEESTLTETLKSLNLDEGINENLQNLMSINEVLWKIEDDIREKERDKEFDDTFIELARSVYVTNDKRFAEKAKINEKYGSQLHEVKSYEKYN